MVQAEKYTGLNIFYVAMLRCALMLTQCTQIQNTHTHTHIITDIEAVRHQSEMLSQKFTFIFESTGWICRQEDSNKTHTPPTNKLHAP